jgi:hypothetical protein
MTELIKTTFGNLLDVENFGIPVRDITSGVHVGGAQSDVRIGIYPIIFLAECNFFVLHK